MRRGVETVLPVERTQSTGSEQQVDTARYQIESWKSEAADQTVVSASAVQDKLFDLWGELRDYAVVSQVEQWLSLTVERDPSWPSNF